MIFGPLTILGFPVVGSYILRSIAVKNTLDTYGCSTPWPLQFSNGLGPLRFGIASTDSPSTIKNGGRNGLRRVIPGAALTASPAAAGPTALARLCMTIHRLMIQLRHRLCALRWHTGRLLALQSLRCSGLAVGRIFPAVVVPHLPLASIIACHLAMLTGI